MKKIENIELKAIRTSPMNPRKTFDQESLQELADNIRQHGLLQPITVRKVDILLNNDGSTCSYEVVCGERRYRAFKLNKEKEIPCIVREMNDEEALDAMITENLQRKDVPPMEEAFAFGQLHKNGKSIEEIALRFGKSKRFVAERIKLDALIPELKEYVNKGWMNLNAAMHICKLDESDQREFFEEYEDGDLEDDPINKKDATDFTEDKFMQIDRAVWAPEFEGTCKTTCANCPFNNANVGCLFYEMKEHDANCTNRQRWEQKRLAWMLHLITKEDAVLVKEGEELETGKTVVAYIKRSYQQESHATIDNFCKEVKAKGYKVVNFEEVFDYYSSYNESDERLQEKLANNDLYRVIVVESTWRGFEVNGRYGAWKREAKGEDKEQVDAMQLVNTYRDNIRKSAENKANKLREVLNTMSPDDLSKKFLSMNENLIFYALILRKCSHKFREQCKVVGYQAERSLLDFVIDYPEEKNRIMRDFMREVLGGSDVNWSADLQHLQTLLLQEWATEKVDEINAEYADKLAKKQVKIEEKLAELGYDTEGKKLDEIPRF